MGYNTRQLKASPDPKKPAKPKDVIYDPEGQWKFPGEITKIPGNHITMKGVSYPVLGIGDNGVSQMMFPGADYHFLGAENVTEYPQMSAGEERWMDKYEKTEDVLKRGGQKGLMRGETHKNIRSSINHLFLRNHDLFGFPGRNNYVPYLDRKEQGGWLDSYEDNH